MNIITIILFFIYTYCVGFTLTFFLKNSKDYIERTIMRVGIGLATLPFLIIFISFLRLPVDWKIILLVSIIYPLFYLFKNFNKSIGSFKNIKIKPSHIVIFILFGFTLFMYLKGSFAYPYFEDDDPWEHAKVVKYIATEKVLTEPSYAENDIFLYLDPRPPAYDSIMAILHQTSSHIMWTLKFFNSLFISLGILFFYFFAKKFIGSTNKALFASFVLTMIPSYLSHFIWSHGFIVTLFFVAFYCLEHIKEDKKWLYVSSFVISGIFLTQETQSVKFIIFFGIYWGVKSILEKKILIKELLAPIFAIILAIIVWWGGILIKFGSLSALLKGFYGVEGISAVSAKALHPSITKVYYGVLGSGTRQHGIYTLKDFFIATPQNMINNPIGIGIVASLLVILGLVVLYIKRKLLFNKKKSYLLITLLWFIFTFLGIHGGTHWWSPLALFSFRFWMLFSIPVALLAAEGVFLLTSLGKSFKINKYIIISLLAILILFTSGSQKYQLNTTQWNAGGSFTSQEEIDGFIWLKELPVNTRVFQYSGRDKVAISFNKFSCLWCKEDIEFRKEILYKTPDELSNFLKKNNYEYLIFDGMSYRFLPRVFGENETKEKLPIILEKISQSNKFRVVHQTQGVIIFKVL